MRIYGTPECPGTYNFYVTVTDFKNNTASRIFTLSIDRDPLTFNPPHGTSWSAISGTPFRADIYISGGRPNYSTTCSGSCPGLSCVGSNNVITISGNPNVSVTTTCYFTVTTSDSCPSPYQQNANATYTVVIQPPPSPPSPPSPPPPPPSPPSPPPPPSCILTYTPQPVPYNYAATVSYTIINGPDDGTFSPQTGTCTSFKNSNSGTCHTLPLRGNLNLTLTVSNAYGTSTCSIKICAPSAQDAYYLPYNTAGATYRFGLPTGECLLVGDGRRISYFGIYPLGPGQQITRHHQTDSGCRTPIAALTYLQAVCADDNANRQVNWGLTDVTDR